MPHVVPDVEKLQRYRAFWRREEVDRPLLGTTIATFPSVRAVRSTGLLQPDDLDVEENLRELDEEWQAWRGVMGDAIWSATPLWAFPWHLAIAGCPIERDGENLWAHPAIPTWDDLDRVRFDPANPWLLRLLEFTGALVEHARGRYPVGVGQLMLGPVDTMLQARGQEALALGFHDAPERVLELGERCADLAIAIAKAQIAATPHCFGGYAGTIRYFWAPGKMVETAEDASFLTSPEAHRRFIAPIHRRIGARFPYTIVHLHSAQLHTVDNLLEIPEIAAIQITPDFGEDLRPRIPVLRRILEAKPLILHGVMSPEVVEDLHRELPARGLALFVRCDTPEQAARTLDNLRYGEGLEAASGEALSEAAVARYWDGNAERWAEQVAEGQDLVRDVFNNPAFLAFVGDLSGRAVLDAGCGEGHNTRILARAGAIVTGVDISGKMVELARRAEAADPLGIRYEAASYTDLSLFPAESFDAVVSFMALMDGPDFDKAAREIHRVLKPGGQLVFSMTHPCFMTRGMGWVRDEDGEPIKLLASGYFDERPFVSAWWFRGAARDEAPAFEVPRFPKTLSYYVNALIDAGLVVTRMEEPRPSEELCAEYPWLRRWRDLAAEFLYFRAVKP